MYIHYDNYLWLLICIFSFKCNKHWYTGVMTVCICGLIQIFLFYPFHFRVLFLLEHRIYWYTYKDRYIQFMTRIMTVLHWTCLWWRDSNQLELRIGHRLQRGLTLGDLRQGFTILGHQQRRWWLNISQLKSVHSMENKIAEIQYKQQKGPFSFLIHVTDGGVVTFLLYPLPNNTSFVSCLLLILTPSSLTLGCCNFNTAKNV